MIWRVYVLLMLLATFCVSFFTEVSAFVYQLLPCVSSRSIWDFLPPFATILSSCRSTNPQGLFFFSSPFFPQGSLCVDQIHLMHLQRQFRPHPLGLYGASNAIQLPRREQHGSGVWP